MKSKQITTTAPPKLPDASDIPVELRSLKQWLCWNADKEPCSPYTGYVSDGTSDKNWGRFDQAIAMAKRKRFGVGFALGKGGLVGLDLDHAATNDVPEPWAHDIIDQLLAAGAYVEWSPSGTGFHAIGRGTFPDSDDGFKTTSYIANASGTVDPLPTGDLKSMRKLEAWNDDRYLTMTGRSFGKVDQLPNIQAAVNAVVDQYGTPRSGDLTDDSILPDTSKFRVVAPPKNLDGTLRPGDDYNIRGDLNELIECKGWSYVRTKDENSLWRRPGKTGGVSASWNGRTFYVFTSSVAGLQSETGYSLFGLYAALEHGGNWSEAARALGRQGYGEQSCSQLSAIVSDHERAPEPEREQEPLIDIAFPQECLEGLPWLMRQASDYILDTAVKPQPELTLAALIALFGTIFGRKVKDDYGTRTNIMALGLAPSGAGKEHPRQVNKRILFEAGLENLNGTEDIASDAGIITALNEHPVRLFQLDEMGRLLKTMRYPDKSPHLFKIGTTLMKMYSSSNTVWLGTAYADRKKTQSIVEPCVCVYGTSTVSGFYEGLSPENLSDGFLARMLVIQSSGYGVRKKPSDFSLPEELIREIKHWHIQEFGSGGNLSQINPVPQRIEKTPEADARHEVYCQQVHQKHDGEDDVRASVWARAPEKVAKLALIYACCDAKDANPPLITVDAVAWAIKLVNYSTRLVLEGADGNVSASKYEAEKKKLWRHVTDGMTLSALTRKTQWLKKRDRDDILDDLVESGAIFIQHDRSGQKGGAPKSTIKQLRQKL